MLFTCHLPPCRALGWETPARRGLERDPRRRTHSEEKMASAETTRDPPPPALSAQHIRHVMHSSQMGSVRLAPFPRLVGRLV